MHPKSILQMKTRPSKPERTPKITLQSITRMKAARSKNVRTRRHLIIQLVSATLFLPASLLQMWILRNISNWSTFES